MTTIAIDSTPAAGRRTVSFEARHGLAGAPARPQRIPLFVPADQRYYWTGTWQKDEAESLRARAAGRIRRFADSDDPTDVARWLLSSDDD